MRKTKLICTIGPACEDEDTLTKMCLEGMNVARLNFSHGTHPEHQKKFDMIKKVREKLNLPIAIMLDTKGPEYRIKTFENKKITVCDGDIFTFTTDDIIGNQEKVSVNYEQFTDDLSVGDTITVNNGLVIFEVLEIKDSEAKCKVVVGGELSDRKSMHFPGIVMNHDFLSEQDKEDLLFGIKNDVDFVAASFVSKKSDVESLRKFLDDNGGKEIDIIAKIEESLKQNAKLENVVVNFVTLTLSFDAEEKLDEKPEVIDVIKKIEPNVDVINLNKEIEEKSNKFTIDIVRLFHNS